MTFLSVKPQEAIPKSFLSFVTIYKQKEYWYLATLLYLAVPNLIFFSTWFRFSIGIPLVLGVLYVLLQSLSEKEYNNNSFFSTPNVLLLALLAVFISWYVGIGNFQPQVVDYDKHHAVFRDLLFKSWPVMYDNHLMLKEGVFLDYYLAWYLPPTLLAKLFNNGFIEYFIIAWSSLGLFLAFYGIAVVTTLKKYWVVFLLLLFGDLESAYAVIRFLGKGILEGNFNVSLLQSELFTSDIIFDNYTPSYATFLTQYEWAPQHTLATLLVTPLVLQCWEDLEKAKSIVLILGMSLLWSPFVSIGLLPIIFLVLLKRGKSIFSISNSIGLIICLAVSSYYLAHLPQPFRWFWEAVPHLNLLLKYPIFILVKFGILSFFLFLLFRGRNDLKWLLIFTVFLLSVFPLIYIGKHADFAMRASGPIWYLLIFLVIRGLESVHRTKIKYAFMFLVLISCMRYYFNGPHRWEKQYRPIYQATTLTQLNKQVWFNTQYFGKKDSFFYKYISKRP